MNRKQRRAQQSTPSTRTIETADQIPLRTPDRTTNPNNNGKKTKTLYEIAAEKQAELLPQADRFNAARLPTKPNASNLVTVKVGPDGTIVHDDDTNTPFNVEDLKKNRSQRVRDLNEHDYNDDSAAGDTEGEDQLPPFIDTLMLAISLGAIHFTLETLTVHQYAEEFHWGSIIRNTAFVAIPTLFLLVHLCHGHVVTVSFLPRRVKYWMQQVLFVSVANVAGCYLIQLTNDSGYYAVMKKAPSIGTLWVWAVIELGLAGALAGVVGPGFYAWWYGYGIY